MRVSFGQKIGNVYVGISSRIDGTTGVIIALFALCVVFPLYFAYYVIYYLIKGIIFTIKKINEATLYWNTISKVILWGSIITGLIIIGLISKMIA